jgi:hypothetical protein
MTLKNNRNRVVRNMCKCLVAKCKINRPLWQHILDDIKTRFRDIRLWNNGMNSVGRGYWPRMRFCQQGNKLWKRGIYCLEKKTLFFVREFYLTEFCTCMLCVTVHHLLHLLAMLYFLIHIYCTTFSYFFKANISFYGRVWRACIVNFLLCSLQSLLFLCVVLNSSVNRKILGAFAKLRKATSSSVYRSDRTFVCLSVRPDDTTWLPLRKVWNVIWCLRIFRKSAYEMQFSLKFDKSNGCFTFRPTCVQLQSYLVEFFLFL